MRLTLRTLLAYLDDILDESDARELQQKIDESEMATQLVHRIRHIVGQTRLDSPALGAEGIGAEANSVSEYLDNTLPAEDVPEFERICLDSDVQLGEVAACHQILTIVLGEPAEITPRLKNRVYKLIDMPQSEHVEATAGETTRIDDPVTDVDSISGDEERVTLAPEVQPIAGATYDSDEHWTSAPDYLRKPKRGIWKPLGIAALIAFCLAFAGLRGMGPLDQSHPIATWIRGEEIADASLLSPDTSVPEVVIPGDPSTAESIDVGPDGPSDFAADSSDSSDQPIAEALPLLPEANLEVDEAPLSFDAVEDDASLDFPDKATPPVPEDTTIDEVATFDPVDPATDPTATQPLAEDDLPLVNPTPTLNSGDTDPSLALPLDDASGDLAASVPPNTNLENPIDNANDPIEPPEPMNLGIIELGPGADDVVSSSPPAQPTDESDAPPSDASNEPREVGKFLSEDQLLARFNPISELWDRVPARNSIREEDVLLSFPIFRPQLMLSTGMQLTLVGPAKMRLAELGSDDSPSVRMEFGRATIESFAQVGSRMEVQWNSHSAVASLADMNSSFAIEVSRQLVPGADVQQDEAHTVVNVYTKSGSVDWQLNESEPITVAAGQRLTIVDGKQRRVTDVDEFPAWIDGTDARPRDPEAIRSLLPEVTVDRPISLSLKEQADSRRLEVRSLAVCSLAFLGEFDPLLVAMNDNRMKAYWSDEYRALTQAMLLSPETAGDIQAALRTKHGPEGTDLFRLLWGFDSIQLKDGGAQKLVSYLDHPSSDFRIVAHENLKAITGTPSLYMPHYGEKQRKLHVFKWKDKLNKGQIVYQQPPEISVLLDDESANE